MASNRVFALLIVGCFFASSSAAQTGKCPPGMVWGGGRCEPENLCPNGKPPGRGNYCDPPIQIGGDGFGKPESTPQKEKGNLAPCQERTIFFLEEEQDVPSSLKPNEMQRLLVVAGPVAAMLDRYRTDLRRAGGELDPERLELIYRSKGKTSRLRGDSDVEVGIGDLFAGRTHWQVWLRRIKDHVADELEGAEEWAVRLKADLLCGANIEDLF